jgi:hypothetical protein
MTNTILGTICEDSSLQTIGTFASRGLGVLTDNTYFPSTSRCALVLQVNPDTSIPPINNYLRMPGFATTAAFWSHGLVYENFAASVFTTNALGLGFLDSAGLYRLAVRATGTAQQLELVSVNAAGTVTHLAYSLTNETFNAVYLENAVDIYVNYASSGQFQMYVNGTLVLNYSGNLVTDSATGLASVDFNCYFISTGNPKWCQCRCQTADTRGIVIATLPLSANGATMAWSGGNYGNVNGTTINDTTPLTAATAGLDALFAVSTAYLPSSGGYVIDSLVTEVRGAAGQIGPQNLQIATRTVDGTLYTSSSVSGLTNYPSNHSLTQQTNPHTGVAFVVSDFGSGFNVGAVSVT